MTFMKNWRFSSRKALAIGHWHYLSTAFGPLAISIIVFALLLLESFRLKDEDNFTLVNTLISVEGGKALSWSLNDKISNIW